MANYDYKGKGVAPSPGCHEGFPLLKAILDCPTGSAWRQFNTWV